MGTTTTVCLSIDGEDVDCKVTAEVTPYRPARINADPDDCYEAEGGIEILEVVRTDTKAELFELTPSQLKACEQAVQEDVVVNCEPEEYSDY